MVVKPKLLLLPWFAKLWHWYETARNKTIAVVTDNHDEGGGDGNTSGTKSSPRNYRFNNRRWPMKKYILCTAVICLVFSSGAQAKGCIKGALVGGAAGSMAGHGKLGAVAGCVVGRHNANKADAEKNAQTTGSQPK